MNKTVPLSLAFLVVATAGVVGYKTLKTESHESTQVLTVSQAEPSGEPSTPDNTSAPAIRATAESNTSSPVTEVSMDIQAADIDESHVPQPTRQAPDVGRAPTSAPSAGQDYAHHPRPGTEQPISAPVSKAPQQPVN